jgi:hypothetical protein
MDEGSLGIDIKFQPETVALGFHIEATHPQGVDEFDDGELECFPRGWWGLLYQGLDKFLGDFIFPDLPDCVKDGTIF